MKENNSKKNKNKNKNPLKFSKNKKSGKPEDNFDWSKILKIVFGWGAVVIAAVIVMQLFKAGTANFVEVSYNQYELLLNSDKIEKKDLVKHSKASDTYRGYEKGDTIKFRTPEWTCGKKELVKIIGENEYAF